MPSTSNTSTTNHFYLICFNLKTPRIDIIDNIKSEENDIFERYGNMPKTLVSVNNLLHYMLILLLEHIFEFDTG